MHVTPSNFFRRILRSEALVYKSYFFITAVLRKLFGIRFSYKHCNFSRVCLLVKMASKTVTRSIPATPLSPSPGLPQGISPPFQSRGWGISKFCDARGLGICQPWGQPELLTLGFLSKYYYTEEFTGKTSRLAHLVGGWGWQGGAGIQLTDTKRPIR